MNRMKELECGAEFRKHSTRCEANERSSDECAQRSDGRWLGANANHGSFFLRFRGCFHFFSLSLFCPFPPIFPFLLFFLFWLASHRPGAMTLAFEVRRWAAPFLIWWRCPSSSILGRVFFTKLERFDQAFSFISFYFSRDTVKTPPRSFPPLPP